MRTSSSGIYTLHIEAEFRLRMSTGHNILVYPVLSSHSRIDCGVSPSLSHAMGCLVTVSLPASGSTIWTSNQFSLKVHLKLESYYFFSGHTHTQSYWGTSHLTDWTLGCNHFTSLVFLILFIYILPVCNLTPLFLFSCSQALISPVPL